MSDTTLRKQIRDWWRTRIEGADEIDVPAVAAEGALRFRQDEAFCARFLDEFLTATVYEVGRALLTDQRSLVMAGTRFLTKEQAIAEIESERPDWSQWMELDPLSGKHIALFAMTKEQAIAAATERETAAMPNLRRAALLRHAAGRLRAGQKIGDVWTADELDVFERRLIVGKPKVSLGPIDMLKRGAAD